MNTKSAFLKVPSHKAKKVQSIYGQ